MAPRRFRLRLAAPMILALAAPAAAAPAPPPQDGAAARIERLAASQRLAQTYSSKCVTPNAICLVDPKPIGSPCACGASQGYIER